MGFHPVRVEEREGSRAPAKAPCACAAAASRAPTWRPSLAVCRIFWRPASSLSRALHILSRETSRPAARDQWSTVHDDVVGGMPLAAALAKWPAHFSRVHVAMVRAGEAGGFLDVVLSQIADFQSRDQELKGKSEGRARSILACWPSSRAGCSFS